MVDIDGFISEIVTKRHDSMFYPDIEKNKTILKKRIEFWNRKAQNKGKKM